jgi:hypothetical protein
MIRIAMEDGREIAFPAEKFRRLRDATSEQLAQVQSKPEAAH